ncbi:MAG: MinD/ParA family protein [Promethearchaeota archaeon]
MKVIAFHSYKGGTGKTHLSSNLAAVLARQGKKTALVDFDFRGPNLHTLFGVEAEVTINDWLYHPNNIEPLDILVDFAPQYSIPLQVAFASTDFRKIGEVIRADKRQRQEALKRILQLKDTLANDFDYLVIDTAPGVQMESIDGLVISDIVCLVLKVDDFDIAGTRSMISQLYALLDSKNYIIVNRVVTTQCRSPNEENLQIETITQVVKEEMSDHREKISEEMLLDVIATIPCYCDLARLGSRELFAITRPEHPFTRIIESLAEQLG